MNALDLNAGALGRTRSRLELTPSSRCSETPFVRLVPALKRWAIFMSSLLGFQSVRNDMILPFMTKKVGRALLSSDACLHGISC
jgi:hypothetical protein